MKMFIVFGIVGPFTGHAQDLVADGRAWPLAGRAFRSSEAVIKP
ncbi:MAG: hypothetical protein U1E64_04125 [Sphingomonadaceae bacterium]